METEEVLLEEDTPEEVEERAEPLEILYREFQVESGNKEMHGGDECFQRSPRREDVLEEGID